MDLYIAVIADVIDSRNITITSDISERLLLVNDEIKSELLIPFKCYRGDEIENISEHSTVIKKGGLESHS